MRVQSSRLDSAQDTDGELDDARGVARPEENMRETNMPVILCGFDSRSFCWAAAISSSSRCT